MDNEELGLDDCALARLDSLSDPLVWAGEVLTGRSPTNQALMTVVVLSVPLRLATKPSAIASPLVILLILVHLFQVLSLHRLFHHKVSLALRHHVR